MSKKEIIILAILIGLCVLWPTIDRHFIAPRFPAPPPVEQPVEGEEPVGEPSPEVSREAPVLTASEEEPAPTAAEPAPEPEPSVPEETATLHNTNLAVTITSHGGAIKSVTLKQYRASIELDSPPVALDFSSMPALVYENLPGLSGKAAFSLQADEGARTVVLERTTPSGLRLQRTLALGEGYVLTITDKISNQGPEAVELDGYSAQLGVMNNLRSGPAVRGMVYLGMDSLSPGGEPVAHFGKKIRKLFTKEKNHGIPKRSILQNLWRLITGQKDPQRKFPVTIRVEPHEDPVDSVDWVAAKNKYFVQILTPEGGGEGCLLWAERQVFQEEIDDPDYIARNLGDIEAVSAVILFPSRMLEAGEAFTREMEYYIGPKKYKELAKLKMHRADVMEFGMLPWLKVGVLHIMNAIHFVIPNYGIAIILLTMLVRVVFWPVTHKSTESMRRMQEIQPMATEIREKYKENPQKQQQALMALYKEHKVNPLGGCLPILIQIPVFLALFVVLRGAIELRFSPFLWIRDLSEPENLFAGVLPIPLNILPLLMAATMFWQQKLTPGAGDSQQQKMMAFMPLMLLFIFYKLPSGLVLYWTTSQCLMIVQQLLYKRKRAAQQAGDQPATP